MSEVRPTAAWVMQKEVLRLKADNSKLQEELEAEHTLAETLGHFHEAAKAENEKLRALLQDVAICACGHYCYGCPHQYDGCDRDKRLKAEGIEVNNV